MNKYINRYIYMQQWQYINRHACVAWQPPNYLTTLVEASMISALPFRLPKLIAHMMPNPI